jgi:RimJ/RimL family protein N-acetyltransferase
MIRGETITLRVVQERDLETLFRYYSDIDNRGEFFPLWLPSEAVFKHDFHQHGF